MFDFSERLSNLFYHTMPNIQPIKKRLKIGFSRIEVSVEKTETNYSL